MTKEEITENTLKTIVNSINESTIIINTEGKILFANKAFGESVGRDPKEIIGSSMFELFQPDVAERRRSHVKQVVKTKETSSFEDERAGRHFIAYMTPMLDEAKNVDKVLIIAHDITDKKRAELAIEEKEKTFRTILENLSIGFFRTTPEGTYVMANKALAEMYGYSSPEELINSINNIDTDVFVHQGDRDNLKETLEKYDYIEQFESQKYKKDKNIIWTLTNARRVKDDYGKTVYYEGTSIDITQRRQLEDELLWEKEKFTILVENAPIAMALIDKNGTYLYLNQKFSEIFGYDLMDIPDGKTWFKKAFPDQQYRQEAISCWKNYVMPLRKGESLPRAFTLVCKDGTKKRIYINCVILAQGLYIVTYEDITEKERIEARYRSIFENATAGIYQTTRDGRFIIANPAFVRMLGYYSFEDLTDSIKNITTQIYVNPDDRKIIMDMLNGGKEVKGYETQFYRKDGSKIWVSINMHPVYDQEGNLLYYQGIDEDITERKNAEMMLKEEKEKFSILTENAPFGMALIDANQRYLYINPKFKEMFGYDLADIPDRDTWFKKAYPDKDYRDKAIAFWKDEIETFKVGESASKRFTVTCKDGSKKIVDIIPVILASGIYLMTFVDITEKEKKEEELAQLRQQYIHAQKMEALGTLTGGIAHDFNNFLTAIMGYATLSEMKINKDYHIKKYIDQILAVAKNMADLVKNLLAFSRKQPINLIPLDINSEIKATKKLLKRLLTENIDLKILTSDENPIVMADQTQLNQILFNMATNAKDAMPDGGTFTIEIDTATIDEDFIKTNGFGKKGDYALISISDTGMGMDKQILDKIFDPFFTTKEPGKGTGLGLASVYGIVKQHNGHITVESSPGNGTMFNIYLPLVDITSKEEKKEDIILPKGTATILIGEDNDDVRGSLKEVLEHQGYKTITANDGEELVTKFKSNQNIDIIITDLIMPKKSGAHAYREIRAINNDIIFIFISGYEKDMLSRIPADDKKVRFISKPIKAETLIQTVGELITFSRG